MGQIITKFLSALIDFGFKRSVAVAILALASIPVVHGVSTRNSPARHTAVATASAVEAAADLAPALDFAGAAQAAADATNAEADSRDAVWAESGSVARPLYPYSVVPGGVRSADEVRSAANSDNAVRLHYAGLNISNTRLERLNAAKLAYVSYRRGDNIFWTRNAVLLPKGERVMTDGTMMLRARCGNRISEVPMAPVESPAAAVAPEVMELPPADVMAAPLAAPAEVPLSATPLSALLIPEALPVPTGPNAPAGFGPPLIWAPTGGGASSSGPSGPGTGAGSPSGPTGPGGGSPSGPGSGPGSGPSSPSGPGSGGSTPPVPAPEPGEMAMLAAGLAAVLTIAAARK